MTTNEPRRIVIPLKPFLEPLLEGTITKDLCEGEEICPTCNGFGIKIITNVYGLDNDPNNGKPGRPMFPYKNQSLVLQGCLDCYNGVVNRCKFCGELLPRGWLKHDCEQQRALDRAESDRKEAERFEKAPIAPPEVVKDCHFFYSDYFNQNEGFFEDWDTFFDEWWDEAKDEECPVRPEYVWITEPVDFHIDAHDICENATQDLYEDAYDDISDKNFERLQSLLDEWCKSCGVGTSYKISHKYKVRIPWEEYEKMAKELSE